MLHKIYDTNIFHEKMSLTRYIRTANQYVCTSEDFPSARSASRENPERGAQGEALSAQNILRILTRGFVVSIRSITVHVENMQSRQRRHVCAKVMA